MRTYEVKLPNIECERCTLQIIQVMEDTIHGPYNVEVSSTSFDMENLYHQCIDVTLKGAATSEKPKCTTGPLVGGQTTKSTSNDAGVETTDSKNDDGCALSTGGGGGWLALLLLAASRKKKLAISRPRV